MDEYKANLVTPTTTKDPITELIANIKMNWPVPTNEASTGREPQEEWFVTGISEEKLRCWSDSDLRKLLAFSEQTKNQYARVDALLRQQLLSRWKNHVAGFNWQYEPQDILRARDMARRQAASSYVYSAEEQPTSKITFTVEIPKGALSRPGAATLQNSGRGGYDGTDAILVLANALAEGVLPSRPGN